MLKPLALKIHHDLSVRLENIAEKQVPVKLKPIVASGGDSISASRHAWRRSPVTDERGELVNVAEDEIDHRKQGSVQ